MSPYQVYRSYLALKLHFSNSKFDFFKSNGITRASKESYSKCKEHEIRTFEKIAAMREPKTFLVGNFIFGSNNYIREFTDKPYIEYRKYLVNGDYIFGEEIKQLRLPYKLNFDIENSGNIPYILYLYNDKRISLYTCVIFNRLLDWCNKIENPLIQSQIDLINKSSGFFKYDENHVKKMLISNNRLASKD